MDETAFLSATRVDETAFLSATATSHTVFVTGLVDLTGRPRLLDVVPARTGTARGLPWPERGDGHPAGQQHNSLGGVGRRWDH